jgi:hypothetical protein
MAEYLFEPLKEPSHENKPSLKTSEVDVPKIFIDAPLGTSIIQTE